MDIRHAPEQQKEKQDRSSYAQYRDLHLGCRYGYQKQGLVGKLLRKYSLAGLDWVKRWAGSVAMMEAVR